MSKDQEFNNRSQGQRIRRTRERAASVVGVVQSQALLNEAQADFNENQLRINDRQLEINAEVQRELRALKSNLHR